MKRGFTTKKAAEDWSEEFKLQQDGNLNMPFSAFVEIYKTSLKDRLKLNTLITKEDIIDKKITPFFRNQPLNEIDVRDVFNWQNQMMEYRDEKGNPYSHTYVKTMHNQLSAIFNFAIRYYDLSANPAAKAGNPGKEETKEMLYWTKEEYLKFADVMMDYPIAYYAFEVLYWCGLRVGELLALTPKDFDF